VKTAFPLEVTAASSICGRWWNH